MVNNETRYGNVSEEYTGRNWAGGCTIGGGGHRAREKELHLLLHGAEAVLGCQATFGEKIPPKPEILFSIG